MSNRILKESICTSDTVDKLSWFEEVFFYRLIVNCDDYGRMDARPAILRSRLFPLKNVTDKQVEQSLDALRTAGIVEVYKYDDRPYLQLRTWDKHQQIRAKKSKYPSPIESDIICNQQISDENKCPRNPIQSESESESNNISPAGDVPVGTHQEDLPSDGDQAPDEDKPPREMDHYQALYDHYQTLGLIKHKALTTEMRNAIDTARRRGDPEYDWDTLSLLLDRHAQIVKLTAGNGQFAVKPRPLLEFFGQRVHGGTALICSEYADDGAKWLQYKDGNPIPRAPAGQRGGVQRIGAKPGYYEHPPEDYDGLAVDLFADDEKGAAQ